MKMEMILCVHLSLPKSCENSANDAGTEFDVLRKDWRQACYSNEGNTYLIDFKTVFHRNVVKLNMCMFV